MIQIKDILHGWLTLSIEDYTFRVSYLSDPVGEISRIFNSLVGLHYDTYNEPEQVCLDGEGNELYLTFWKDYEEDIIILWREYSSVNKMKLFKFKFDDFCKEWNAMAYKIKDDYKDNFLMDEEEEIR